MNKPPSLTSVVVGLSGGVDSSVSAYLLKEAGYQVTGVFMKNWEGDDEHCPAADDLKDAQSVADALDIPFRTINFSDKYWERVFSFFLEEYRAGRTPNPDILCNKEIKFRAFLDFAKTQGADFIATGHYVRKNHKNQLLKGLDPNKDQSYFLYALDETQIASSLFPVGELEKSEVRKIAAKLHLKTHDKKDSTGICFIGERKFKQFLNDYLPAQPGNIETLAGEIIGRHDGLMFHTIGQRQGLQIGGLKNKPEGAWYVAKKDLLRNVLIVVQGTDHPALFQSTLHIGSMHWINEPHDLPLRVTAKIRYRQADQICEVTPAGDNKHLVTFDVPQRAVTPGQSVVFYQDDVCLGGGVIEAPISSKQ